MPNSDARAQFLFDGDCGVCSRAADIMEKLDVAGQFSIIPYQSRTEDELRRYGLSYEKCSKRAYVISPAGRVYGGAFAANYFFLKRFPWSLIVVLIYAIPPLLLAEVAGYYLIARYRYKISRWLGLEACRVKP